jgi:transposase
VRIGQDGPQLLGWLDNQEAVADLRQRASVEILRQVWSQQYALAADGTLRWREKQELLPSAERIASPHDPEARYSTKNSMEWVGYKVHVTGAARQICHI